jgi:plasmid stabilization system protein ParE
MPHRVVLLRRAEENVQAIVAWLAERSPRGAAAWLVAFEEAKLRLAENPLAYSLAPEDALVDSEIRQVLLKTRRGRRYRALFTIADNAVRILHVRGPGQSVMRASDLPAE